MVNKVAALVDNESTFLLKFKMIFQKLGLRYNLETFNRADDIINVYTSGKYQVTLIDLNLNDASMNGYDLAKHIAKINNTKIYIISNNDGLSPSKHDPSMTDREFARSIGAEGWIIKKGVKLVRRLERLFNDIANENFGQFKVYDDGYNKD